MVKKKHLSPSLQKNRRKYREKIIELLHSVKISILYFLYFAERISPILFSMAGDPLRGFAKDRKELILQYLSGLASNSPSPDQKVVENFLAVSLSIIRFEIIVYSLEKCVLIVLNSLLNRMSNNFRIL